ncbi:uncharacterized protein CMC5_012800 [Chondromyces crocatus]|uniref:PEGA domain-containing protein n=2 Tax=Chondromyces crocatus TaxID=52 RepID=A0A0K1E8G8_CHOCO|nr:uncharacterized protein CMC5_012800 [Chondromyces crocatus]
MALGVPSALANDTSDPAWVYFNAGQQAYAAGKYPYAIQAFQQAFKITARPGLVFSIAQAYRKQYVTLRKRQDLQEAVTHYRKYLSLVPDGGRRADAVSALEELEPALERLQTQQEAEAPSPVPEETMPSTRLMVSASVRQARISVDGGAPSEMPLMVEVSPGKHTLRIVADGYFPEEREVVAAEGGIVALDMALREKPALLDIVAKAGSRVTIDGRPAGELPFGRPIELEAGSRFVTVTRNGFKPFSSDLLLERGGQKQLVARLEVTQQRVLAYVLLGAGAATAGLGALLALRAAEIESEADEINTRRVSGSIQAAELNDYNALIRERNEFRIGAATTLGAAAAISGIGALLFAFDPPGMVSVPPRATRSTPPARPEPGDVGDKGVDISAAPVWAPGVFGLTVRGHF